MNVYFVFQRKATKEEGDQPAAEGEHEEHEGEHEGQTQPPPCKKKSCALSDLFGETFSTELEQASQPSPITQAMIEVNAYRATEPLELSADPLREEKTRRCVSTSVQSG